MNIVNKEEKTKPSFSLYGLIAIVGIFSMFIHGGIMGRICSNCAFLTLGICILAFLPALLLGFIAYYFLRKTRFAKYLNSKSIGIICIIMAVLIIIPAIISYYDIVPPKEVTNWWKCDSGQEICNEISGMMLIYDTTYAWRDGSFTINNIDLPDSGFNWKYDESSNKIKIIGLEQDWNLILNLDINTNLEPHYTMTTYYISDKNFSFFDVTLFDGVNWTGAWDYNDQGR